MVSTVDAKRLKGGAASSVEALLGGLQSGLDRMLSVWYGTVYDFIFEHFAPYRHLQDEIIEVVEAGVVADTNRRDVRILEIGCGPGNFTFTLAKAGFSVVGVDAYGALVELAREKRRARHFSNLAFQQADVADGNTFPAERFDQVVSVHSLYVHPHPRQLLESACRLLKPGGHAIFVNPTRRIPLRSTVRELIRHGGLTTAFRCLLWLVPNAVFEAMRKRNGPHYWQEEAFRSYLQDAGFTVLDTRRTFFNDASLLVWARKDVGV